MKVQTGYVVAGRLHGRLHWVESRPERCALHGTMGDYGYTSDPAKALVFETRSTAGWHASRIYGFDGHHGQVATASDPHIRIQEES